MAKEGRFEGSGAPKSQTLIVLSYDPDTILVPSGEIATVVMSQLPWAFVCSHTSSSLTARQANRHQFCGQGGAILRASAHPNPKL